MAKRNTYREDEELEEQINLHDILRIGVYVKPYMSRIIRILAVVVMMSCIAVVVPYLTKIMIDSAIPSKNLTLLGELTGLMAVLIVMYEFGLRYRTVEITRVGQLMLKDMRRDIFTHIQTLPFSYFDSRPHGKILIRVVNYVNTLSDTLSSGLINVISDVFTFLITLVVMFVVDWRLALFSLVLFPFLIAWVLVLQHFQRRAYQVLSNKQSNLNAFIHESIAGVKTTQTFAQEAAQFKTFQGQQDDVRTSWMKAVHIQFLMWPGIQTISVMTIAFIYYVGVTGFGAVNVSTGVLIAFVGYANNFWNPVISIGNFYNQLITCSAYLERIFETLDVQPEIRNAPDATELPQIEGRVDFNDVVFRYEPDGRNILNLLICMLSQAAPLRWLVRPVPAKPRLSICCRVFTTLQKVRSQLMVMMCVLSHWNRCVGRWASCCRIRSFSPAMCARTSVTASWMRPMLRSKRPRRRCMRTSSLWICRTDTTRWWRSAVPRFPLVNVS